MKSKILSRSIVGVLGSQLLFANISTAQDWTAVSVEEKRIETAKKAIPNVVDQLSGRVAEFGRQINDARNLTALTQVVIRHGNGVWQDAVKQFDQKGNFDDRALYWARLQMTKALKSAPSFKKVLPMQQKEMLWKFELLSRGQQDIKFDKNADKKILVTGFDPFFLDRHINQSNPSGVAALALDDLSISNDGTKSEVESLIIPVRFEDFDRGMIEQLLSKYYKDVDMIVTISMGRSGFDLERFPGLRRSSRAPDNNNVFTGASATNPIVPSMHGKPLQGPEFVEFSLPIDAMKEAIGTYKINDNRKVTTVEGGAFSASSLSALNKSTSVQGAGGGYLSNEISYRSILLRNAINPVLPVGHIHTPRISQFDAKASENIVKQIKQMLTRASKDI